jgi:hypothetical protein
MTRSVRCWPRPIYTNLDLQMLLNVRSNTVINVRIRDKADIFLNRCRLSLNWPGPKTKNGGSGGHHESSTFDHCNSTIMSGRAPCASAMEKGARSI